ncbi:hypothetical protein FDP51_04990 [Enterococcus mundtii]|uniref:hypothetical protein n=1 Tax=Enterococcus mundtii TaxID=53346 RepID=UPI001E517B4A|nr:hypothetical protein [Enterococcus mundtii]MRI73379.1 hypothetical protein [Enterococcus mundtii]
MAISKETVQRILSYFDGRGWSIPDVASALDVSEQYLRRVLNNPEQHPKQITDIIAHYKIR